MIQLSHHQKQIQANAVIISSIPCQNKAVISLDDLLIGYLTREDDNKMTVLDKNGNKFIIPSCKVISIDQRNASCLLVDLEYHDLLRYKVDDHQSSYDKHNSHIIG
jgi:hypothetical protein